MININSFKIAERYIHLKKGSFLRQCIDKIREKHVHSFEEREKHFGASCKLK